MCPDYIEKIAGAKSETHSFVRLMHHIIAKLLLILMEVSPLGAHHTDRAKVARSFTLAPPGAGALTLFELAYVEVFPGFYRSPRLFS